MNDVNVYLERREEGGKGRGEGEGRRREWGGRRMISNLRLRDMDVDGPTSGGWEEKKEEGEGEEEKGSRQGLQDKKDVCKRCFFQLGTPSPPLLTI